MHDDFLEVVDLLGVLSAVDRSIELPLFLVALVSVHVQLETEIICILTLVCQSLSVTISVFKGSILNLVLFIFVFFHKQFYSKSKWKIFNLVSIISGIQSRDLFGMCLPQYYKDFTA